jgi:hypothetical protein
LKIAVRSAQMVKAYVLISTLHPVYISPVAERSAAPT